MATSTPVLTIGPIPVKAKGGNAFDDGTYPSITKLRIRHGEGFVSMQTVYATTDGQEHWSPEHGSIDGGIDAPNVDLASDEYLISLSGYYTEGSVSVVRSLTFQSNKNTYGPYGSEQGTHFSILMGTGKIVGFFGTSDEYINSIAMSTNPVIIRDIRGTTTKWKQSRPIDIP